MVDVSLKDRVAERRCPYCHGVITLRDDSWVCTSCGTVHHQECFREHKKCSVHGCARSEGKTQRSPCSPPEPRRRHRRWVAGVGAVVAAAVAAAIVTYMSTPTLEVESGLVDARKVIDDRNGPVVPAPTADDTSDPAAPARAPAVTPHVVSVDFMGDYVVTTSRDGDIDAFDREGGSRHLHQIRGAAPKFCQISSSRERALVGAPHDPSRPDLTLLDVSPGADSYSGAWYWNSTPKDVHRLGQTTRHEAWCNASLAPDGRRALVVSHSGWLELWDVETSERIGTLSGEAAGSVVSIAPDGRTAVSGGTNGVLHVWDLTTLRETGVRPLGHGAIRGVQCASDDTCLVVGESDFGTTIVRVALRDELHIDMVMTWPLHDCVVALAPAGSRALLATEAGVIEIWDLTTATSRRVDESQEKPVIANATFSPDGARVAFYAEALRAVLVVDATTARVLQRIAID